MVSGVIRDRKEKGEGRLLLRGIHEGPSGPSGVLGEVPLTDMGIVSLELVKEFICRWEAAVGFADAQDPIYYKLLEAVVPNEVEKTFRKFIEESASVVLD